MLSVGIALSAAIAGAPLSAEWQLAHLLEHRLPRRLPLRKALTREDGKSDRQRGRPNDLRNDMEVMLSHNHPSQYLIDSSAAMSVTLFTSPICLSGPDVRRAGRPPRLRSPDLCGNFPEQNDRGP